MYLIVDKFSENTNHDVAKWQSGSTSKKEVIENLDIRLKHLTNFIQHSVLETKISLSNNTRAFVIPYFLPHVNVSYRCCYTNIYRESKTSLLHKNYQILFLWQLCGKS